MRKSEKSVWREEMGKSFSDSSAFFVAEYSGMTVEELCALRKELKAAQAEFRVLKNTLAKKAVLEQKELASVANVTTLFKGQVGTVFVYGDVAAAAKAVSATQKKNEKFKVVGGFLDASLLSASDVDSLASIPSREVLLSKIIGSLVAPHRGLLGVVQAVPRAVVSVLNQIKEQKAAS